MKKCVSILLALAMCVLCVPAGVFELPASAAPATMTTADVTRNIENYWNVVTENGTKAAYWNRNKSESQLISEADSGDYLASISRSPCSVASGAGHLRANGCTSNTFKGGSQCNGFAAYMEYVGCGVTSHKQGEYFHEVDDSFLFQPGDRLWLDWRSNEWNGDSLLFRRSYRRTEHRYGDLL